MRAGTRARSSAAPRRSAASGPTFTANLPGDVSIAAGESVRLPLRGAMGAGNTWTVEDVVPAGVVDARIEIGPPPAPRGPFPESSSAAETLVVSGRSPGQARIQLRLGRSWEPDRPLARHALTVAVIEAP